MLAFKNFRKDNTPRAIAKVGNALLLIGATGAAIGLAIAAPPIGLAVGVQIAAWSGLAGGVGKILSKFFGTPGTTKKEEDENL